MSHSNAILTPAGRLMLAQCVVDGHWPLGRAAERFNVSVPTAARWAKRYVELREAGMQDRPRRPLSCPHRSADRTQGRWFAAHGVKIQRLLTDNGSCYRSKTSAQVLKEAGIRHKRTRPYRPQTNGKVERFNRILLEEWTYARPHTSEPERQACYPGFIEHCNYTKPHTAGKGASPASRVTKLPG